MVGRLSDLVTYKVSSWIRTREIFVTIQLAQPPETLDQNHSLRSFDVDILQGAADVIDGVAGRMVGTPEKSYLSRGAVERGFNWLPRVARFNHLKF